MKKLAFLLMMTGVICSSSVEASGFCGKWLRRGAQIIMHSSPGRSLLYTTKKRDQIGEMPFFSKRGPRFFKLEDYILSSIPQEGHSGLMLLLQSYRLARGTQFRPFSNNPEDIRAHYGKETAADVKVKDVFAFLKAKHSDLFEDLNRVGALHLREPFRIGWKGVVLIGSISAAAFAFNYLHTKSSGYSAATAEPAGSASSLDSYRLLYGTPRFSSPEDQALFEGYMKRYGQFYTSRYRNSAEWIDQSAREQVLYGSVALAEIFEALEINQMRLKDPLINESLVRALLQMKFSRLDSIDSDFGREIHAEALIDRILEIYDPDGQIQSAWRSEHQNLNSKP